MEFLSSLGQKPMEANLAQVRSGRRHLAISQAISPSLWLLIDQTPRFFNAREWG